MSKDVRQTSGWSLNDKDWEALNLLLTTHTVRVMRLQNASLPLLPTSPGVYMVCLSPTRPNYKAELIKRLYNSVYVGQAKNLRARCKQHLSGNTSVGETLRAFVNLDFWYIECQLSELNEIEKKIFDIVSPMSNKVSPPIKARLGRPVAP